VSGRRDDVAFETPPRKLCANRDAIRVIGQPDDIAMFQNSLWATDRSWKSRARMTIDRDAETVLAACGNR
jgi:hypothetical protein